MKNFEPRIAKAEEVGAWRRHADRLVAITTTLLTVCLVLAPAFDARAKADLPESPKEVLRDRRIEGIEDRVSIRLETAGGSLAGAAIAVAADREGRVTLTGKVGSDEARARAARLASYTVGVHEVQNQLVIDPAIAPPPVIEEAIEPPVAAVPDDHTDEDVARWVGEGLAREIGSGARVKESLFGGWLVEGEGWEFSIEVEDGGVVLDGTIGEEQGIARLTRVAGQAAGVRSVATDLEHVEPADDEGGGFFFGLF